MGIAACETEQARIVKEARVNTSMVGTFIMHHFQSHGLHRLGVTKVFENACVLHLGHPYEGGASGAVLARHLSDDLGDVVELLLIFLRCPLIGPCWQKIVIAWIVGIVLCVEEVLKVVEGNGVDTVALLCRDARCREEGEEYEQNFPCHKL